MRLITKINSYFAGILLLLMASIFVFTHFFIQKEFRNKGLSAQLLKAAIGYAGKNGATIVEGYPQDVKKGNMPAVFAWTGFMKAFSKAGFREVERRSETRPIMRYYIK